jgi:hypothetical protein
MDDNELPKKKLWTKPGGQRGLGRPKSRWIDGVAADAKKLGCTNWLADAQDRGRWRPRHTQGCRADDYDDDDDLNFMLYKIKYNCMSVTMCTVLIVNGNVTLNKAEFCSSFVKCNLKWKEELPAVTTTTSPLQCRAVYCATPCSRHQTR